MLARCSTYFDFFSQFNSRLHLINFLKVLNCLPCLTDMVIFMYSNIPCVEGCGKQTQTFWFNPVEFYGKWAQDASGGNPTLALVVSNKRDCDVSLSVFECICKPGRENKNMEWAQQRKYTLKIGLLLFIQNRDLEESSTWLTKLSWLILNSQFSFF